MRQEKPAKGMSQAETFEWLRQRGNRLDEVEAANEKLQAQVVELSLMLARYETKELRDECVATEDVSGDLLNTRLGRRSEGA